MDALNNAILTLGDEISYNTEIEESLKRYADYFQILNETLTGIPSSHTPRKKSKDDKNEKAENLTTSGNSIIDQAYPQVKVFLLFCLITSLC